MAEDRLSGVGHYADPPRPSRRFAEHATTRIVVTVTFLRQDMRPADSTIALPDDIRLVRITNPTVGLYRDLYNTVGAPWVWWLRRTMPDSELAALLAAPGVSVHVLYRGGEAIGFFELDARPVTTVNIAYFGLVPQAIGQGIGRALLQAAIVTAWSHRPSVVTVNTCTADHPRALPTYQKAGFSIVRRSREIWDVPNRLGLAIPDHLRA